MLFQTDDQKQPLPINDTISDDKDDLGEGNPSFLHSMERRKSSKNPYEYF